MQVAKASGSDHVVINSGGKSERFVKAQYTDLPQQAFVEYGNYIGETLAIANELDIKNVTMGVRATSTPTAATPRWTKISL